MEILRRRWRARRGAAAMLPQRAFAAASPAAALVGDRRGNEHRNGEESETGVRVAAIGLRGLLDVARELALRFRRGRRDVELDEPRAAARAARRGRALEAEARPRSGRRQRRRRRLHQLAQVVVDRRLCAEIEACGTGRRRRLSCRRGFGGTAGGSCRGTCDFTSGRRRCGFRRRRGRGRRLARRRAFGRRERRGDDDRWCRHDRCGCGRRNDDGRCRHDRCGCGRGRGSLAPLRKIGHGAKRRRIVELWNRVARRRGQRDELGRQIDARRGRGLRRRHGRRDGLRLRRGGNHRQRRRGFLFHALRCVTLQHRSLRRLDRVRRRGLECARDGKVLRRHRADRQIGARRRWDGRGSRGFLARRTRCGIGAGAGLGFVSCGTICTSGTIALSTSTGAPGLRRGRTSSAGAAASGSTVGDGGVDGGAGVAGGQWCPRTCGCRGLRGRRRRRAARERGAGASRFFPGRGAKKSVGVGSARIKPHGKRIAPSGSAAAAGRRAEHDDEQCVQQQRQHDELRQRRGRCRRSEPTRGQGVGVRTSHECSGSIARNRPRGGGPTAPAK